MNILIDFYIKLKNVSKYKTDNKLGKINTCNEHARSRVLMCTM